jgi:hypothetical protein
METDMRKTSAEYQREYRKRLREQDKLETDVTLEFTHNFGTYFSGREFSFPETLDSLGVTIGGSPLNEDQQTFLTQDGEVTMAGVERLTRLAGAFIDAAHELSNEISMFKMQAVDAAAEEAMRNAPRENDAHLAAARNELDRLHNIIRALMKRVRHDFQATEVKGI